jgi:DNA polymerase III subunit epsilon
MLREIVLDTETTGIDAGKGDRVIEIGCVELINHIPSGAHFHCYINPEHPVSAGAFNVHGLSDAFLADKPVFAAIAGEFEAFIADSKLIIHNAAFDVGFLNMELGRLGRPALASARVLDTLSMARRKHPGASNSLDALCQRYGIDNARRTKHGALMDAEILAEVYIELIGGRQTMLGLGTEVRQAQTASAVSSAPLARKVPLQPRLSEAEEQAHDAFVKTMPKASLWSSYT